MPNTPIHIHFHASDPGHHGPHLPHPHIGLRKVKSILAVLLGFLLWQLLRLWIPQLETHPIFIYIYSFIEIRESSEKTRDFGRLRMLATVIAILVGLPFLLLTDVLRPLVAAQWLKWLEIGLLMLGALVVLCAAELAKCRSYCGLAAVIFIILYLSHLENSVYIYSLMRAFQTLIGVTVAWLINVKLFPYPPRPGSFSSWLSNKFDRKYADPNNKTP